MKNLDLNTLKRLHLLILLGWLLPYITILHLEQIVTPFLVTLNNQDLTNKMKIVKNLTYEGKNK